MTIATWNLERPAKISKKNPELTACLKEINPDILILTETNECIDLGDEYHIFHTSELGEGYYKPGERRTSIYSKYKCIKAFKTFRGDTSLCINLQTPFGPLAVYGTVIGIHGNRRESFMGDLEKQLSDFDSISETNNFCLAGDLNISFGDNFYYTKEGRDKLNASFEKNNLINITGKIPRNIDHIILSRSFVGDKSIEIHPWNLEPDKKLSDHMGVSVTLS